MCSVVELLQNNVSFICSDNLALIQRYPELGIMIQTLTTMLMLSNCCFHFCVGGWCVCVCDWTQTTLIWLSRLLKYSGPLLHREVLQARGLSQRCFSFCCWLRQVESCKMIHVVEAYIVVSNNKILLNWQIRCCLQSGECLVAMSQVCNRGPSAVCPMEKHGGQFLLRPVRTDQSEQTGLFGSWVLKRRSIQTKDE